MPTTQVLPGPPAAVAPEWPRSPAGVRRLRRWEIASPIGHLQVASYHAPPGVSWGRVKVDHAHALLDWINQTTNPVVLGADANTPEIDHPDRDQVRTHWHTGLRRLHGQVGDDVTFGGHPHHALDDAFRRWLDEHPARLAAIVRERPTGPLAVSHVTGRHHGSPGTPRRFDTIWISRSLTVSSMTYDYAGALDAAGSDHALVTADLEAQPSTDPQHIVAHR